jgi:quercetin dioxygenase-like cupin family protein
MRQLYSLAAAPPVRIVVLTVALFGPLIAPSPASAQAGAVHKTMLQDQPFPEPLFHSVTIRTVVDPKGDVARHIHPGLEIGYVISGQARLMVAGQPPRPLAKGDSFAVPRDTVHELDNVGPGPLTVLSTYVVDAGKPVASPAP